ncbi:TonB-dependent receptor [Granulicella sp. dw_53]|uniref:TonB-dependent receptor n=1 Tax=Granulicella sp. dw_53 TaxID=2719792 RepID=UPI001BD213E1|nr:TonB-dependent receptor [Granulicella sp. dw_53]
MKSSFFCRQLFTLAATLILISAAIPAFSQNAALGNIAGTVRDTAGAVVPNAAVVISNTGTGATRNVTTNGEGYYSADFLQPGQYEVILGGGSFGKVDRKNISVTVGSTITVDASLPNAGVSTELIVSSDAPLIETEKVEVSQTVDQNLVSNLPVNGRRYDNFVLLTPNVVPDGASGLISYRGISGIYNTNLIDGANNQQAFFSEARGRAIGAPYVFSQDSIKEFQSSTSGYSAEFGQAAGGQINAITKSGTNATHGDLFYYLRYPSLNALDPLSKFQGRQAGGNPFLLTPTVHQQQQFGGSIGGPIIKDKLFYFFTYDGFRKVNPLLYTSSLSTAALNAYACPAAVSTAQCNAVKTFISAQQGAASRNLKQDIFFPRLDYQLNRNNHLSAEFNWQNYNLPNGYTTSATSNNSSVSTNGRADFHERIFVANWESVVSSRSVNAARFQFARDLEVTGSNAPGPNVSISGITAYGEPNALPRPAFPDEHRWQAADTFSTTRGNHTFKVGVDINLIHEQISNLFQGGGLYTYSLLTGQCLNAQVLGCTPITDSTYGAFVNYVKDIYGINYGTDTGRHYSNFTQVNDPITGKGADDFWNKDLAAFAEDSWKISSKFLFSAGIRYDTQLVPQPPRPYTTSANGQPSPFGNSVTNFINTNYKMIQPRLGFAWSPYTGTVVRGGYGIFYGLSSNSTFYATRVENGVFQQQYNYAVSTSPAAAGVKPATFSYAAGAPQNVGLLFTPPGPPIAAPFPGALAPTIQTPGGSQTFAFRGQDKHFTNPYTHSFDLAVEQELPFHVSLTLSYVGTRGMKLPYFIDSNLPKANQTRTYTVTEANGTTSQVTVPFYATVAAGGNPRPSPNDGIILTGFSGINSWYHAMATSIRKPMSHGLELLVNYTWAKAIDGSQVSGQNGTFNGTNTILDPFNLKNPGSLTEYTRSDLDMRGRFVGSIVYAPTFALPNRYARIAANGWSFSGTATEQTGLPLTANMSGNVTNGIDGGVTGAEVSLFASNSSGRAPQIRRNAIPGPGIRNVDARISRDISIHEGIKMQFFMEAFNVANRRQIISQNTTAYQFTGATTIGVAQQSTPFGTPTSTSSTLYGPRQLQFTAKLFF